MTYLTKTWPVASPTNFDYANETEDVIDEIDGALGAHNTRIGSVEAHAASTANPHSVTKAQVGLGNVDNTSDASKPISTATQTALNGKQALDSDLTAIAAIAPADNDVIQRKSGAWTNRTMAQVKTDLALSKSDVGLSAVTNDAQLKAADLDTDAAMTANSDSKVASQKAVKTALDSRAPTGGVRGQVLTVGASGRAMADVPGIVYPSLLLSPDGSFSRNGSVTPVVTGSVGVVGGVYGNAWRNPSGSNYLTMPGNWNVVPAASGTVLVRGYMESDGGTSFLLSYVGASGTDSRIYLWQSSAGVMAGGLSGNSGAFALGSRPAVMTSYGLSWGNGVGEAYVNGRISSSVAATTPLPDVSQPLNIAGRIGASATVAVVVESVIIFPVKLPASEIVRISTLPTAWTMSNAAANIYQPASPFQQFAPTNKIAAGGATARNAPGTGSNTIATLAAGTLVSDTDQRQNVSSVDYAMLWTQQAGICWVPLSTVTTL